jgi:hypothetical protein
MVNKYPTAAEAEAASPYATPTPTTRAEADARNTIGNRNRSNVGLGMYGEGQRYVDEQDAQARADAAAAASSSASRSAAIQSTQAQQQQATVRRGSAYLMAEEAARRGETLDPYVLKKAVAEGWGGSVNTTSLEASRQTVPTRDYSSGFGAPVLMTPGGSDFYVPYGDRAKTQIKDAKAVYSEGGELGLYQLRPARPGFTPRYGHLSSSGGLNALQSGMFTVGRSGTPVTYTQESAGTKLVPGTDISLANAVLANPQLFSRNGAELYGGDVMRLDGRTITPETRLSTYPKGSGNLAGLVDPFAVNRPKNERVGNIPWSINANSPTFQSVDKQGNLTPTPANKIADIAFGTMPTVSSAKPATQMSATPQPAARPNIFGGILDFISYNISPQEGRGKTRAQVLAEAKATNTAYGTNEKGMLFAGDRLVRVWNGDKTSVGGVSPADAVINSFLNPGQNLSYFHTHPMQYPEMNLTSLGQANQPSKVDRDSAAVGMRLGVTRTGIVTAADMTGNRTSTIANYYDSGTTGFFNGNNILGMSSAIPAKPTSPAQSAKPVGLPSGITIVPIGKSLPQGNGLPPPGTTTTIIPARSETVNTADVPLFGSILGMGDMALSIPLPGGSNVGKATGVNTFQFEMPAGRPSADVPLLGMQKGIGWGDILNKPTTITETVGKAREEKINTYQSGGAAWTRSFMDNAGKKSDAWSYPVGEPTYSEPFAIGSPVVTRTVNPKTGEITTTTEQQMGRTKTQPMEMVRLPDSMMVAPITTKIESGKSVWDVKNDQLSNDLIFSPIGGKFGMTGEQARTRAEQVAAGSRIATSANPTAQNMVGNFVINAGVGAAENPLNVAKVVGETAVLGGVFRVVGLGGKAVAGSSVLANSPRAVKAGSLAWRYGVPGVLGTVYVADVESRVTKGNTDFSAGQISGESGRIFSTEIVPMGIGFKAGYKAPDAAVRAGERGVKAAQMTKLDYLSLKQDAQGQNLANIPTTGRPGLGEIKYNVGDYAKFKVQKGVAEAQGRASIFGENVANTLVEAKVMTKPKIQVAATNVLATSMGKYYEMMGHGKYSPSKAPSPVKSSGASAPKSSGGDTGGIGATPSLSRRGTKIVGGAKSGGLAPEPSLKSQGIRETSTTGESTSTGSTGFAKSRSTDFRGTRGNMKPMNTMQSAISMPQEFSVMETPSLAKATESAAPAASSGDFAPMSMMLMGTSAPPSMQSDWLKSDGGSVVGEGVVPIQSPTSYNPLATTPVATTPSWLQLQKGGKVVGAGAKPLQSTVPYNPLVTVQTGTPPKWLQGGKGFVGEGTVPTNSPSSYNPLAPQNVATAPDWMFLTEGQNPVGWQPAPVVSDQEIPTSPEETPMGMSMAGFGAMGLIGGGTGSQSYYEIALARSREPTKSLSVGLMPSFTKKTSKPFGIISPVEEMEITKPTFVLKSKQAQKSKSGQSIMQRTGQSQVARQAKMQQFDQTLRQVSLPALVSGLKSRQEQSTKQSQKQITGLATISLSGQKSVQQQGQRQVQKQTQAQRQKSVSEQTSIEKLFGKTTTVPPIFPGGVGAMGGEGVNPRNMKAFREHSPTITVGEMTKSLFTGSFTKAAPRRQVRGNMNFARITGVSMGKKKGRGKR